MHTFTGGLDLRFVAGNEFESLSDVAEADRGMIVARNALRLLMMGWPKQWTQLISWNVFKAVFIQRDPLLLKDLRFAFQQGFYDIYEQLRDSSLNDPEQEQVQLYLSNCLSLLPYSDLTPYESIQIPQYIDEQWILVEYCVTPIELTRFSEMRGAGDSERVYAYGLEAITCAKASPHLIFMGTTYPAGQGFLPQINTDMEGAVTVGHSLYLSGRTNIIHWLEQQHNKVHVCGVSLGGSLSLLLAIDQGTLISRVDALNPAGLHLLDVQAKHDAWNGLSVKPQVVIQRQGNDPVSAFGEWIADWTLLHVNPHGNKKGPNAFCDHFLNYAGFADTEFIHVSIDEDNQNRKRRNYWIYYVGRNTFYYGVIAPYTYAVRPLFHFLYQQSLLIGAFLSLTAIVSLAIYTASLLIASISVIAALAVGAYLLCSYIDFTQHDSWFIKLKQAPLVETYFAQLHAPDAPRNAAMDLYNPEHKINIELTRGEVTNYYRVMRCLVKNKEFIPLNDGPKKELLLGCQQLESDPLEPLLDCSDGAHDLVKDDSSSENEIEQGNTELILVERTKAKVFHMRRALTLIERLGQENQDALKQALSAEYSRYRMGKISRD